MIDIRDMIIALLLTLIFVFIGLLRVQRIHMEDLLMTFEQQKMVIEVFADLGDACVEHKDQIQRLEGTINELLTGDH